MADERFIWVAYERANTDSDGGPKAAFTSKPDESALAEVRKRFEEREGYAPDPFVSSVPIFDFSPHGEA
jgi:hypothetical protein